MRNKGFTLAETLITLMVIGVLAVITIPSILQSWEDNAYKTAYRKAYSDINQAFGMAKAKGSLKTAETYWEQTHRDNFSALAGELKVIKFCSQNNAGECWECNGESASSTTEPYLGCHQQDLSFQEQSGRTWYMLWYLGNGFLVDTNGFKKPNKMGKDRFGFRIETVENKDAGAEFVRINPYPTSDVKTKYAYCPSGDCKFKSWLF